MFVRLRFCLVPIFCVYLSCDHSPSDEEFISPSNEIKEDDSKPSEQSVEPSKAVRQAIFEFNEKMRSDDAAVRVAALDNILPKRKHVVRLFGKVDGEKVWRLIERPLEEMKKNSQGVKREFERFGKLTEVRVINSREKEAAKFQNIPDGIPVFRVVSFYESKNSSGSGSYLVIDGEVVFFRGLEDMPAFLESDAAADQST